MVIHFSSYCVDLTQQHKLAHWGSLVMPVSQHRGLYQYQYIHKDLASDALLLSQGCIQVMNTAYD